MRTLADISGHADAADVLLIIAGALAALDAVLHVLASNLRAALIPAAVALIAIGLALL